MSILKLNCMTVGDLIKEFVELNIPNKKDYKRKLGMGYGAIHKYFTNQRMPGYEIIYRLKKLGFNTTKIFNADVYEETMKEIGNTNSIKFKSSA